MQDETETWNGTNWTEVNDLNAAKKQLAGNGTQTSALALWGEKSPSVADITETELWNGSNWTEVNDLNTSRHYNSGAGADNTSAICFAGIDPPTHLANTELWNGTNWTEVGDMVTAVGIGHGNGTKTAAMQTGGYNGTDYINSTQEWDGTGFIIRTATTTSDN